LGWRRLAEDQAQYRQIPVISTIGCKQSTVGPDFKFLGVQTLCFDGLLVSTSCFLQVVVRNQHEVPACYALAFVRVRQQ
jgi:hypothetical protein